MKISLAKPESYSEIGRPWYDTKNGVKEHLKNLDSFRFLLDIRHDAAYKGKERLNEFFLFGGIYYLDSCGNCGKAEKRILDVDDVLTNSEFWHLVKEKTNEEHYGIGFSMNGGDVPPEGLKCAHCQQTWTLENCFDTVVRDESKIISLNDFAGKTFNEVTDFFLQKYDAVYAILLSICRKGQGWISGDELLTDPVIQENDEGSLAMFKYFHKNCNLEDLLQNQEKILRDIFEKVGFQIIEMTPIENEYGSGDWRGPWFLINTQFGIFKIGWRKRVIKIDWSNIVNTLKIDLLSLFEKENVTQSKDFIHAWSYEKVEEYLKKIFDFLSETQK